MRVLCGFQEWSRVTRPLGELRHGAVVGEVFHFDYLPIGGAEGRVVSEDTNLDYLLVIVEDICQSDRASHKQMLCPTRTPKVYGTKAYGT